MRPTGQLLAILGNLVGSREISDRAQLQGKPKRSLRAFWDKSIQRRLCAAGPEITAGDEIQVLLWVRSDPPTGSEAVSFLAQLTEDLHPVRIVFGLGLGGLTTKLGGPVRELDGECFHRAREALEGARREGRWAKISGLNSQRGSSENSEPFEDAANAILRLTGDIRAGWTDRQLEVIRMRRTWPLQKDVARELGVSPSVVSEVLRAARHDAVSNAEDAFAKVFNYAANPKRSLRDHAEETGE